MNKQAKISPKFIGLTVALFIVVALVIIAVFLQLSLTANVGTKAMGDSETVASLSHKTASSADQNTTTVVSAKGEISADTANSDVPQYVSNQVMFTVRRDTALSDLYEKLAKAGIEATSVSMISDVLYGDDCLLLLEYSGSDSVETVCDKLVKSGVASSAESNQIMTLAEIDSSSAVQSVETVAENENLTTNVSPSLNVSDSSLDMTNPNDPFANRNSTNFIQWGLKSVKAYDAWDIAKANGKVTVAIIDSGAKYTHEDLKNNLVSDLDKYALNTNTGVYGSEAILDTNGHGTHVSGIISAETNNGTGASGVSYNAKILPIKATIGSSGSLNSADIIEAVNYIVNLKTNSSSPEDLRNIRVINMSIGGTGSSQQYAAAVASARNAGILVVAAAGNEQSGINHYPAAYEGVIGVSALKESNSEDNLIGEFDSSYSNYGSYIDLAAPGTNIASTYYSSDDAYVYLSGTSMATPMVSGVAAAVFACNSKLTPSDVENILESTAKDLGAEGRDDLYGYGAVDFYAAAKYAVEYGTCQHTQTTVDAAVPATCITAGKTAGSHCATCGKVIVAQEEIAPLGHTEVLDAAVAATCTEAGKTEGKHCSVCGVVIQEQTTVSALGHNYIDSVTAPTCTQDGHTTHTCSRCSDSYIDTPTAALGHTESITKEAVDATCTTEGKTAEKKCSVCGVVTQAQTTIPALGHAYADSVTVPTCTQGGYTTHTCSRCSDSYIDALTNALGHTEVTDAEIPATCTTTGKTEGKHCSVCGVVTVVQQATSKIAHTTENVAAVEATCTAEGVAAGTKCSVCGQTLSGCETVAALGHAWGDWQETKPATCTETGISTRTCTRCNTAETQTIAKLPTANAAETLPSDKSIISEPVSSDESDALDKAKAHDKFKGFTFSYVRFSLVSSSGAYDHKTRISIVVNFPGGISASNFANYCFTIIHITDDGTVEEIAPQVDASGLHFETTFSPFAIGYQSKTDHTHTSETLSALAASCTTTGLTAGTRCSVCGATIKAQSTIAALGHNNQWVVSTTASSTQKGVCKYLCKRCGSVYQENTYLKGDVNNNGNVNIVDAQIVLDMANGKWAADGTSTGYGKLLTTLKNQGTDWSEFTLTTAANYNATDGIAAGDARAIQAYIHG